jgi:phosphohistidine phosphatase
MNLYLLRHGLAGEHHPRRWPDDSKRPLTPKGRRRLHETADAMRAMGLSFDLILTSPYQRTLQTAEIIVGALKHPRPPGACEHLTPNGDPKALIEQLRKIKRAPKNILLVGHEPYLSQLTGLLATGNTRAGIDFKKGGLCKLEIETLRYGRCATLAWLLTPKQMALMM